MPPHCAAERVGKARRQQHVLIDRAAHREDPADLVDGRTDHREIEAVLAADIAAEHIADMQGPLQPSMKRKGEELDLTR